MGRASGRDGAPADRGLSYVRSVADFTQSTQFGYILPNRTIAAVDGPGAFADGTQDPKTHSTRGSIFTRSPRPFRPMRSIMWFWPGRSASIWPDAMTGWR
jgi:hypothetical protein